MTLDDLIIYVETLIGQVLTFIQNGILSAIAATENFIGGIASSVAGAISNLINNIVPQITQVLSSIVDQIRDLMAPVFSAIAQIADSVRHIISDIVGSIQEAFVELWNKVQGVIQNIMSTVGQFLEDLSTGIRTLVDQAVNYVRDFVQETIATVKGYVEAGLDWIKNIAMQVYDGVKAAIQTTVGYITDLWSRIVNAVQKTWEDLVTGAESIISTVNDRIGTLADSFESALGDLGGVFKDIKADTWDHLRDALVGVHDYFIKANPDPQTQQFLSTLDRFVKGPWSPELMAEFFSDGWFSLGPNTGLGYALFRVLVTVIGCAVFVSSAGEVQAEVFKQGLALENPWLPMPGADAIAAYRRGNMDGEAVVDVIRRTGLDERAARTMLLNANEVPSLGELIDMLLRGIISDADFDRAAFQLGLSGTWSGRVKALGQEIPPLDDIIRMARRLVFDPQVVSRYQLLNDYQPEAEHWAAKKGLSAEWMRNYWAAHWDVPSVSQGFELLQRGVIDRNDLEFLMRDAGVAPFWRDQLLKISYRPFTRVDIRRMHKVGALTSAELPRAYQNIGYNEADAQKLAEFTIRLNTKTVSNTDQELGKLSRAAILSFYDSGLVTAQRAIDLLISIGATPEAAALYIAQEDIQKHVADRKAKTAQIIELAHIGELTPEEAQSQLQQLGLTQAEIDKAMTDLEKAVTRNSKLPSRTDAGHFLSAGLIQDDEYLRLVKAEGFNDRYAAMFLVIEKGKKHGKTGK